jgi:DNA-binding NtrC family response regulator
MRTTPVIRIAVINDHAGFLGMVESALESHGPYEVFTFRDEETSLAEIRAVRPQLVIIDVIQERTPSGWELAVLAGADRELGPVPTIVTSPDVPGLRRRVDELREVANLRVISKPFTLEMLEETVQEALHGTGRAEHGPHEPI